MGDTVRVMLYVNDEPKAGLLDSVEEAKRRAEQYIKEGSGVKIDARRWKMPIETLTYNYELEDWVRKLG